MQSMTDFTNLYRLAKTLRFELIPLGKTLENIEKNNIIQHDEIREKDYSKMKKTIDVYHREYIETALSSVSLPIEDLNFYYELYTSSDKADRKKKLSKQREKLRKEVSDAFKDKNGKAPKIGGSAFMKKELPLLVAKDESFGNY